MITALSLSPAVDKIYFVENFKPGCLYRVEKMVRSAGGKGINVARVASLLGEKVSLAGFKAGEAGNWIENEMKKLGVDTKFIEVLGETRTNNNIIDCCSCTETEILEVGPYIRREDADRFLEVFKELLKNTSVLVCSGGLPQGLEKDFYRKLVEIANSYNVKVILDASGEPLKEAVKAAPFMIKPNLRELECCSCKKLSEIKEIYEASIDIISTTGVQVVAASLGGKGALLTSCDACISAVPPDIEVVNTIGSGDSMVAGIAVGLSRGEKLSDALRLGMACAASNTQFAEIGFIDDKNVKEFLKQIEITTKKF